MSLKSIISGSGSDTFELLALKGLLRDTPSKERLILGDWEKVKKGITLVHWHNNGGLGIVSLQTNRCKQCSKEIPENIKFNLEFVDSPL